MFAFSNESKILNGPAAGATYTWNFADGTPEVTTTDPTVVPHTYTNIEGDVPEGDLLVKTYKVTLTTTSANGCKKVDTVEVRIPREWKRRNVLTPNNDGKNDFFNPAMGGEIEYDLQVFNRWGEIVFDSQDSKVDWNGKVQNSGADCPEGTYYYVWKFKLVGGFEKTVNGTVTLLR